MYARVFAQFGMEGRSHDSSLPDCYGIVAFGGDHFDTGANAFYLWGTDENHFDWLFTQSALPD
jgi:hypothetical protein